MFFFLFSLHFFLPINFLSFFLSFTVFIRCQLSLLFFFSFFLSFSFPSVFPQFTWFLSISSVYFWQCILSFFSFFFLFTFFFSCFSSAFSSLSWHFWLHSLLFLAPFFTQFPFYSLFLRDVKWFKSTGDLAFSIRALDLYQFKPTCK